MALSLSDGWGGETSDAGHIPRRFVEARPREAGRRPQTRGGRSGPERQAAGGADCTGGYLRGHRHRMAEPTEDEAGRGDHFDPGGPAENVPVPLLGESSDFSDSGAGAVGRASADRGAREERDSAPGAL